MAGSAEAESGHVCDGSGEVLYNGIVLPTDWPPNPEDVAQDPEVPFYLNDPPAVIPIDVGRQLFVDDFLIESTTLTQTMHRPTYYPGNPVFTPGMPFSDGVWYDPADKLFKMWYYTGCTNYAESPDGIHWQAASRDVVPGTPIVEPGSRDSAVVWLDLEDADPQRRFKLFRGHGANGVWAQSVHYSADGIHWSDVVFRSNPCGDRSTIFWNPFRRVWVWSMRHSWTTPPRRRRYHEVRDLEAGPYSYEKVEQLPLWTGADSADPPRVNLDTPTQLYNLDCLAYESVMLGFYSLWHGQPHQNLRPKPNDVCIGYSRDGWHFHRPDREAFFGVSEDPTAWNHGNVQSAAGGLIVMGDRLYFYMSGRKVGTDNMGLATLRRDGFTSMDAGAAGGTLTTRPVRFGGKHLFVNVDAPDGELRVEVLDADGEVIEPFSMDRCRLVRADSTIEPIAWEGGDDLSALAGKGVRFRFHLRSGRLYAFWVSPDTSGDSGGYVGAGGPGFAGQVDREGIAAYRALYPTPKKNTVPTPSIWPKADGFSEPVDVRLEIPRDEGKGQTTIRYTTDGTEPTADSKAYSEPFTVSATTTVKARAFRDGAAPGAVAAAELRIVPTVFPPKVIDRRPTGRIDPTDAITLTVTTDVEATCRYSTTPGVPYDQMEHAFAQTGGLSHSTPLKDLEPGTEYVFYVKACDAHGNAAMVDCCVNIIVRSQPRTAFHLDLEAQNGELTPPMRIVQDDFASQSQCVLTMERFKGAAAYTFTVPELDDYVIWIRIAQLRGTFGVKMDDSTKDYVIKSPVWEWIPVIGSDGTYSRQADGRVQTLDAGEHTFTVSGGEALTRLDRLIITNDRDFVPQDN